MQSVTSADVARRRANGETLAAIANDLSVSRMTLYRMIWGGSHSPNRDESADLQRLKGHFGAWARKERYLERDLKRAMAKDLLGPAYDFLKETNPPLVEYAEQHPEGTARFLAWLSMRFGNPPL